MAQTSSEEHIQAPQAQPSPIQHPSSHGGLLARRVAITITAGVLFASFFLPWAHFFGSEISGLDIQKNFQSYRLVWLLPLAAFLSVVFGAIGLPAGVLRRIAGIMPFAIAIYSMNKFGNDFWQLVAWGGWLALAAGAMLILIPGISKPQPKA